MQECKNYLGKVAEKKIKERVIYECKRWQKFLCSLIIINLVIGGIRVIFDDISNWILTLPKWQQKLSYLIMEKKHISEKELNEIYDFFKTETKLKCGKVSENIEKVCNVNLENSPNVIWQGVCNLHGVNKLKSDSELNVSAGLTVVYGENGSGKSGYTRLLNNAFISRGDQDILPNIFENRPEQVSADFKFSIDGNNIEYKYPDDKDEYAFKTIRNFDAKSAADDMNRESKIDFAPSELSFFDKLLSACSNIQRRLDDEIKEKKMDNPVLKYFSNDGSTLSQMKELTAKTEIDDIRERFGITDTEKEQYEQIKKEKANLVALDINRQTSLINQVLLFLSEAERKYAMYENITSNENIKIYNQQIKFLQKSKLIYESDGIALFEKDDIEQLGTKEWKDFINSAKKYYDKINNHEKCPLCGRKVDGNDLLFKYWKFLESDAENNYNFAKEAIRISKEGLKGLNFTFLVESSVQKQWLTENYKKETDIISNCFEAAELKRNSILNHLENEKEITEKFLKDKPDFQGLIEKINQKKDSLNQESINLRIAECTRFENEFIDKSKVTELLPIIESYIEQLKWESLAEKCKIKTRIITNKQKELFKKYVTDDYLKTFERECQRLNADFNVNIVSRGSSGQTLKKLQIQGNIPGKVLSEGEQRAISIANFLTEVSMDVRNIGIVLDDPVCSLDHKRRSHIVKRLIEEAQIRQVVIFTHEITFFMELKMEAERNGVTFEQETIRKICGQPGDISNLIPWQGMNVKDRTGKLKDDLQKIVSVFNSGDMDKYYYEAKEWCELLRESWERAVEEILFNDAIQRYNPCVQTQRLKKAPFTHDLYTELEHGMTECSSWCHDQARAINANIPSIDNLKYYIECFEEYCKRHRAR